MLDWPVDSCVFLSLVFLSPRFKSKLKGKHHISSSIIELTNVRFCGLIVGPCVAFLKLVMVGVVAPSTGCEMQTWANSMESKFYCQTHNGSTHWNFLCCQEVLCLKVISGRYCCIEVEVCCIFLVLNFCLF